MDVSKLDAAKRQLETAINLFFAYGDPVSIHTLTAAAHELLRDTGKGAGVSSVIKDQMAEHIRPERRTEYVTTINEAENYFKHADRDPKKLLSFNPLTTTWLIWDAIEMYHALTSEITGIMLTMKAWFFVKNPELLTDAMRVGLAPIAGQLNPDNRERFRALTPMIESIKTGGK